MPKDAPLNGGAPLEGPTGPVRRVSEMQTKLHRWAAADPGRRFDDLFNFVYDPATLIVAFDRVAGNTGSRTAGVDGLTVADVEEQIGVPGFLDDLRAHLKAGTFRPLPVRERKIPKPGGSGKVRSLGIPTVADRVVQAALKLVLEPIFEADFLPVSYGFRPMRRAHDAIAEIHRFGTLGYRWVLDADIEACFDSIDHTALMDRVRRRVKDKRVLLLVKAFLKAGILTELGENRDTHTGTPQGGILTPPTQWAIGPSFTLRVGVGAALGWVAWVAWVVAGRDGVADDDLVRTDEDVFDEESQDALAFGDGRGSGLVLQAGEEVFEVVGELEIDGSVGELGVEGVGLLAQAGLAGAQLGHPGPEFVEGDQLLLVGADEPCDRLAGLG
jgi:retron-type reverse transcriptase